MHQNLLKENLWALIAVTLCLESSGVWARTYTLAGTQAVQIPVTVNDDVRLILVRQYSLDVVIQCQSQDEKQRQLFNSPLGRVGIEAAVLARGERCSVHPKSPEIAAGRIAIDVLALSQPVLGANLIFWQRYSALMTLDWENAQLRRAAITELQALAVLTPTRELRLSLQLMLAHLWRRQGEHAAALLAYRSAQDFAPVGDPAWAGIFNGAGLSHLARSELPLARTSFDAALVAAKDSGLAVDLASAQNNLCLLMQTQDQIEAASGCYKTAAKQFTDAGELETATVALSNWAFVAQRAGDPENALRALTGVLARRRSSVSISGAQVLPQQAKKPVALTHIKLSQLYLQLGQFDQAFAHAQRASDIFKHLHEGNELAKAYRLYAKILAETGQKARALSYLEKASAGAGSDIVLRANLLADTAALMPQTQSLPVWQQASALLHQQQASGNDPQTALLTSIVDIELAHTLLANKQFDAARKLIKTLTKSRPELLSDRARLALLSAQWAVANNELSDAKIFTRPQAYYRQLRDAGHSVHASLIAVQWLQKTGRSVQAQALLLKAAHTQARALASAPSPAVAASIIGQSSEWKSLWTLQPNAAEGLAETWNALNAMHTPPHFVDRRDDLGWQRYQLLAGQLKSATDRVPRARRAIWLRDIDQLDMQLQRAAPARIGANLAAWQHWLAPKERLVRFILGEQRSIAIWLRPDGVECVPLPARGILLGLINAAKSDRAQAMKLSQLLLPATYAVDQSRVWVMPDAELHALAFASLATYQPSFSSGVIVIAGFELPDRRSANTLPTGFEITSLMPAGAQTLPGAQRARQALAKYFAKRFHVLNWQAATPLPAAAVFHFAGHGWANAAFPGAAGLSTDAPARAKFVGGMNASQLHFAVSPRLIVLNACEAAGVDQFGAGLSLARALTQAQGSLVLGPLTMIDDSAALHFDQVFFPALERMPPDQALMYALRTLGKATQTRMPFFPPWQLILSAKLGEMASTHQ